MSRFVIPLVALGALVASTAAFAGCVGDMHTVSTPQPVTTADTTTTPPPITIPTKPSG